uniref:Ig-like domain-containing protein n=1 Tax=Cynoglossus semilaevis TaxID=244447 RepID=A0A3P8UF35_CYNSE
MFVFSAKQTPSPGEGRGRGLRPGKGPPPPEEPAFGGFKLKPIYMTCELNKEREVVWKKNGQLLKQKANKLQINIIGMQHAVTIQNSSEEDGGVYSCEVANQEDVKTSTNVKCIGEKRGVCPNGQQAFTHTLARFHDCLYGSMAFVTLAVKLLLSRLSLWVNSFCYSCS